MMTTQTADDGEGASAARQRRRHQRRTAAMSMLGALAVGSIVILGKTGPGQMHAGYAVLAVIAMAILLPLAVHFNDRTKDELDRLNALRANSFGLYACLLGGWSWLVLSSGGMVPPPNMLILVVATGVATLGRYAMLKLGY